MPRKSNRRTPKRSWQEVARAAQEHREHSLSLFQTADIPTGESITKQVIDLPRRLLDEEGVAITELALDQIVQSTLAGSLSVQKVTQAFLRRAALAQKLASLIIRVKRLRILQHFRQTVSQSSYLSEPSLEPELLTKLKPRRMPKI